MTAPAAVPACTATPDRTERALVRRVLDALLREDHLGLRTRGRPGPDGWWEATLADGRRLALPLRPDGFLADDGVAAPVLLHVTADGPRELYRLDGVLAALAPAGDDAWAAGWRDFVAECTETLAAERIAAGVPPGPAPRHGFAGLLGFEALAALRDHPVYPLGRGRHGLTAAEQRSYAPEFAPAFPLEWVCLPREQVDLSPRMAAEGLPDWWPGPREADRLLVPVHPLTRARTGAPRAAAGPPVVPTLSMRTVALRERPGVHVKLPLPVASLGRRNKRSLVAGTLADGAAVQRLLAAVLRREPALARTVVLADEERWLDGPDELVGVLVRHLPTELDAERLVPLAALPAPHPGGGRVLDTLAGQDPRAWFDTYLRVLLDWHVALWLRYGIALEAHQQNVTLALGPGRLRLVYKDNDGARIDCARLAAALGSDAPFPVRPGAFADRRMAVADPDELADVFVTITLHLCVGALVQAAAGGDGRLRADLLRCARERLLEAAHRWCDPQDDGSRAAAARLRAVLDADRWPIKAMVTAGSIAPRHSLACADINKYYLRTGPNYLRAAR